VGAWLSDLIVALAVALMVLVVVDLLRRPSSRVAVIGGLGVVGAGLGLALIWWPFYASTGAGCNISPTTLVLGEAGSPRWVEEAPDETDRESTASCISRARWRTAGGAVLVVVPWAAYLVLARTRSGGAARPDGGTARAAEDG